MKAHLLYVEDDESLGFVTKDNLELQGYRITHCTDGKSALQAAIEEKFDLCILDVMLPEMDGFEVLKNIRQKCDIPVLMLTARGEEADRIVGLEIGADDYLPKTFSTRELLARLRAVTRRAAKATTSPVEAPEELIVGALRVNTGARTAVLGDQPLTLTPVEFDLLASLSKARGRVKTREALLDEARDRNWDVFDRSIDVHISALRKKLGDDAKNPRWIRTVRSAGYLLINPEAEGA
jgi:DNA-binding response OmpR family regulator